MTMTDRSLDAAPGGPFRAVFGPLVQRRTYTRILYLLIGFPLGLAWFVLYVTTGALGIGLLILGIGAVILLAAVLAARPLGTLERHLAATLTGVPSAPPAPPPPIGEGAGRWLASVLGSGATWKALAFLLLRFPLGLASWIVAVVAIAISWGLILSPLAAPFGGRVELFDRTLAGAETLLATLAGLVVWLLAVHLLNGLGALWGLLARALLGGPAPARPERERTGALPVPAPFPA